MYYVYLEYNINCNYIQSITCNVYGACRITINAFSILDCSVMRSKIKRLVQKILIQVKIKLFNSRLREH